MTKSTYFTCVGLLCLSLGVNKTMAAAKPLAAATAAPIVEITTAPQPTSGELRLEEVILKEKQGSFNGINGIRKAIEMATEKGVAANTIVLLLLLPLIATLVSVLHYVFGLSGYGIFMPTMIAVAFLATGILGGLVLFGMILTISLLSNMALRRFKLHFWPSRSINLMFVALGTFGLMIISIYFPIIDLSQISIFPVLFMILLAEEFVRTQLNRSRSEAKKLMAGTLVLSILGAGMMNIRMIQEAVLRYPELCLAGGLAVNFVVGNYTGIRFSEIKRFKKAIRSRKIIRNKI